MFLQSRYIELKMQLEDAKKQKAAIRPRWEELRLLDDGSYSNWGKDIVNQRSKAEEREYNQLGKQISALNNQIMGLQKKIVEAGLDILKDLEVE